MSTTPAEHTAPPAKQPVVCTARAQKLTQNAVEVSGISRREFLYYIWGASMVMMMGGATAALIWSMLPRFRAGEFGGDFFVSASELPEKDSGPEDNPQGRFWFSNTDDGIAALYKVCTHLGCLFKWVDTNHRFECPCHGSKFQLNGIYIEGPAPRSLDRFEITAVLNDGTQVDGDENGLLHLEDPEQVQEYIIHTGLKIKGPTAGQDYA